MNTLKWLLAGILVGGVAVALRNSEIRDALTGFAGAPVLEAGEAEPILGYDGMDQETLIEWLDEAELDGATVEETIRYEEANLGRDRVLQALRDRFA